MNLSWILLGVTLACVNAVQSSTEGPRRFEVDVPPNVESGATVLVLRDVTVPRNAALVICAHAVAPDSTRILLGSVALPGIAQDAKGMRELRELRIIATRGLRQWAALSRSARRLSVEIEAVAADSAATPSLKWSVRAVRFLRPD
jgi:hypothetical protein